MKGWFSLQCSPCYLICIVVNRIIFFKVQMIFSVIHSLFLFISVFIYISFTQGHFKYLVISLQKWTIFLYLIITTIPNCYTQQPGFKRKSDDRLVWKVSKKIFQCNHWIFRSNASEGSYWLSRAVYWYIWFPPYRTGLFLRDAAMWPLASALDRLSASCRSVPSSFVKAPIAWIKVSAESG